jgi:dTDP-4-dehydrorhamnose reductase
MRILLTGHLGQLATDFKAVLPAHQLILTEYEDLPLEDTAAVLAFARQHQPTHILNCAAYNRVDDAEDNPHPAFAANTFAPRNLALAARELDATLIHFSTDYVFDGPQRTPYVESDLPCPKSVYGASKASGELMVQATWHKHFIFRVCGLFGYAGSREKGSNFVETMLSLAAQGKPLRVVDDQILTPTATVDIVQAVTALLATNHYGLYHLTNSGHCSWFEFTQTLFQLAGLQPNLTPVPSSAYVTKAQRPAYSVLDNARLRAIGHADLPHWSDALQRYLAGRQAYRKK